MQQLQCILNSNLKVGINSRMIKEISNGPILAKEVELIEIGINETGILKNGEVNFKLLENLASLGNEFSIHGPTTTAWNGNKVDLGVKCKRNYQIMENVFKIANHLNAKYIVMHGDKVGSDYKKSCSNILANLKKLTKRAYEYSVVLLIENLARENKNGRIGILPNEVLTVIEVVGEENLKFCFDVGHANLVELVWI